MAVTTVTKLVNAQYDAARTGRYEIELKVQNFQNYVVSCLQLKGNGSPSGVNIVHNCFSDKTAVYIFRFMHYALWSPVKCTRRRPGD